MAHITIFDTTLRDGEQAPGISLDAGEKLEIARQLARLGVDVIEAGFPIASDGDWAGVKAIADEVGTLENAPVIAGLARATKGDIDRAATALEGAKTSRIHVFLSTSEIHRKEMLRDASEEEIITQSVEMVKYAKGLCDQVEFSPQDATRTEPEFLKRVVKAVAEAGAHTINIPDTVGYALPHDFGKTIKELVEIAGDSIISVHCHNDLGLAVANSLEAARNGARQIEVAVNGIGERAGNCSLEEIVMAIKVRSDLLDLETQINTKEIARASRLVQSKTGYPIQYNKAIVGRNAFAHESGIHQHGVLANRETYEIMTAEDLGLVGAQIVLGKHSGRHAFVNALADLGYTLDDEQLQRAFERFKRIADRKTEITTEDLEAIVEREAPQPVEETWELLMGQSLGGTSTAPTASVTVKHVADGKEVTEAAVGDGMVEAMCHAISRACGVTDAKLTGFRVSAISEGEDSLGDVSITIRRDGTSYTGRGLSTDIVLASGRAWLSALNRSVRMADQGEKRAQVTP